MKIIHIVESLGRGGLERMVIDLVEEQVKSGNSCIIICLFKAGELFEEAVDKGIECHVCHKGKGVDLSSLLNIRKIVKQYLPDVVHTHNAVSNYYAYFSTIGMQIPCLINTRHGMGSMNPNSKRERYFKKSLRKTNYIVAVCEAAKNKLIEDDVAPSAKCVVVNNGIKLEKYLPIAERRYNEAQIVDSGDVHITIGSIGRLNWAKDYFTLLETFKLLLLKFDNINLKIAGGGELKGDLIDYAKKLSILDKVVFHGDLADVGPFLEEIDVFVLTSVSEGYPLSLLEASAAGVPIVATDVGGNSEIVKNGNNGFIVPPKDAQATAKRISELIDDDMMKKKCVKNGLDWVKRHGDVCNMSQQYNALYVKSLNKL